MSAPVFVMSDMVGSTALWETHGQATRTALETHDRLLHGAIESAGGRVFKHTGDGMIAIFDDADNAVTGALNAVAALTGGEWGPTGALEVRVSVHAGPAAMRDGDSFGPPVNKVARINGIGHGGQVLVSDVARQLMSDPVGVDRCRHCPHQCRRSRPRCPGQQPRYRRPGARRDGREGCRFRPRQDGGRLSHEG
jgi:class 3 adenylate cyclase